jgi:hypothetical protein
MPLAGAAVLGLGLTAAGALPGQAATPTSGTLTPTSGILQWSGGPFTPPGAPTAACTTKPPTTDDFKLTVKTPAGYGLSHRLQIQVDFFKNEVTDFDVCLFDARGEEVATAASQANPELITVPPTSGTYTVRVIPFTTVQYGTRYTAAARFVDYRTTTTSSLPRPGYTNYGAPENLPSSHDAGEPSLGVNWRTNRTMYQSGLSVYRVEFDDRSNPARALWADRSARPPQCHQVTSFDPYLFTDNRLGRTFSSQLIITPVANSLTCFTDDDGDNWTISQGGGVPSGADHQSLGAGPFSPNDVLPHSSYPHAVYYCSQNVVDALCSLSRDGGRTFQDSSEIYRLNECNGLHGHIKVGPDGTAYVPNKSCQGKQGVSVSRDNGKRWTVRRVPTSNRGFVDPSVAIGANNTVYFGYQNVDNKGTKDTSDDTATARIAVSQDEGLTWMRDIDVGAQLGLKNIVFPAVIAGDDNRAAFAFLGTKTAGNYQANQAPNEFKGVWHLYIATTTDGGRSWVTVDATPNDPVQRGSICTGGTTCGGDRNLLDFFDADIDRNGRVLVAYADGCTAECVNNPNPTASTKGYRDAYASIARQSAGPRLFGQFDPLPDLVVRNIQVSKDAGGVVRVSGVATNIGRATAQNVTVRFSTGCICSGFIGETSPPITLRPGDAQRVSVVWQNAKPGTYTITGLIDPRNVVRESNERNNRAQASCRVV